MSVVDEFFPKLDARWGAPLAARIPLRIIGSAALMLQTNCERGTRDSDVLETHELSAETKRRMLDLAGSGSALHLRHRT